MRRSSTASWPATSTTATIGKHGRKHGHGHHKAKQAVVRTGAGTKRFSLLRFYPADTTVKAGDSVTWKWTGFNEVHTVTFGPDDVLAGLAASLFAGPTIDPVGGLPTEAPGAPVVHSATVHGNGLLGAGIVPDPGVQPAEHLDGPVHDARRLQLRLPDPPGHGGSRPRHCVIPTVGDGARGLRPPPAFDA